MLQQKSKNVWSFTRVCAAAFLALALFLCGMPEPALGANDTSTDEIHEFIGGVDLTESAVLTKAAPDVGIPSGILMTGDGRVLWERDADAERAMASTTKIMTALLALEDVEMSGVVTITLQAAMIGESSVPLETGDTMTVQELLDATLVHSANNAAFALAEYVGGDSVEFVEMMNEKAEELGLDHTHYTNPHGLDQNGHYTTARDLAKLSLAAMANERFASIVGADTATVGSQTYENTNRLIGSYDGATGVKTGFTSDAGYCVVVSAERNGIDLFAVVLGAKSDSGRFEEAETLLDWGFEHYTTIRLISAESTAALVPVSNYLDETVAAIVPENVTLTIFDLGGALTMDVNVAEEISAPIASGDEVGTLTVMQGTTVLTEIPLVAAEDVAKPDAVTAIKIWFTRIWREIFGETIRSHAVTVM